MFPRKQSGTPLHARAKRGVGYLPQEASIFRKLSVEDNVVAILEAPKLTGRDREEQLQLLLEARMEHIRESIGIDLSGGEARARRNRTCTSFEALVYPAGRAFSQHQPHLGDQHTEKH